MPQLSRKENGMPSHQNHCQSHGSPVAWNHHRSPGSPAAPTLPLTNPVPGLLKLLLARANSTRRNVNGVNVTISLAKAKPGVPSACLGCAKAKCSCNAVRGEDNSNGEDNNNGDDNNSNSKRAKNGGNSRTQSASRKGNPPWGQEPPAKKHKVQTTLKSTEFVDSDIEMEELRAPGQGSKMPPSKIGPPAGKKKVEVVIPGKSIAQPPVTSHPTPIPETEAPAALVKASKAVDNPLVTAKVAPPRHCQATSKPSDPKTLSHSIVPTLHRQGKSNFLSFFHIQN